ncbi:hypothetical protein J3R82DRAFT_11428 [Butyriboletus roseoflavus]|nr:hypothetical protein J3R82DRAFT_11428 [Butyriboletus roseoflavus]
MPQGVAARTVDCIFRYRISQRPAPPCLDLCYRSDDRARTWSEKVWLPRIELQVSILGRPICARVLMVEFSDAFIRRMVANHLHKDEDELNIIALHLGSGASACAIRGGKSIDTSMGLTPLSGLPGATRAGDVDPSLIFHYTSEPSSRLSFNPATTKEIHVTRAEEILNSQAGWKALAGTTDFGEITRMAELSTPLAAEENPYTLAFHILLDRVLHYVGAYHVSLRGKVDALVFAGGIGERSRELRSAVGEAVNNLGYSAINEQVNHEMDRRQGTVIDIGKHDGGIRTLVCRTDEQFEMARECSLTDEFWL